MKGKAGYKHRTEKSASASKLRRLPVVSAAGMALLTGFLFLAAFICLRTDASGALLQAAAYVCCAASAFPAGFAAAKSFGRSGLLCGLLCSLPLCILLLILCLALCGSVGSGFLIGTSLILLSGALGGITALNLRHKRKYR